MTYYRVTVRMNGYLSLGRGKGKLVQSVTQWTVSANCAADARHRALDNCTYVDLFAMTGKIGGGLGTSCVPISLSDATCEECRRLPDGDHSEGATVRQVFLQKNYGDDLAWVTPDSFTANYYFRR